MKMSFISIFVHLAKFAMRRSRQIFAYIDAARYRNELSSGGAVGLSCDIRFKAGICLLSAQTVLARNVHFGLF
jgi:hypothetical protein